MNRVIMSKGEVIYVDERARPPTLHEVVTFFVSGGIEASFPKNLESEVSTLYIYIYILYFFAFIKKHPKYEISCKRHENMHIFI